MRAELSFVDEIPKLARQQNFFHMAQRLRAPFTQITPSCFFVDLNLPFAGLVHKPDKPVIAGLHNGLRLTLTVIGFGRHTFQLSAPAERISRQTTTPKA